MEEREAERVEVLQPSLGASLIRVARDAPFFRKRVMWNVRSDQWCCANEGEWRCGTYITQKLC